MNPVAKLSDLVASLDMQNPENKVYFDRQTAEIVLLDESLLSAAEEEDDDEECLEDVPEWQREQAEIAREIVADENDRFIDPPDKFEFHEYRHMEEFIETLDNVRAANELARAIRGNGAFGRFKGTLARFDLLDDWYKYRDNAMKEFAIEWAEENNVAYEDDLGPKMKAANKQRK